MLAKLAPPDTVTYAGAFVLKGRELDRALALASASYADSTVTTLYKGISE